MLDENGCFLRVLQSTNLFEFPDIVELDEAGLDTDGKDHALVVV